MLEYKSYANPWPLLLGFPGGSSFSKLRCAKSFFAGFPQEIQII